MSDPGEFLPMTPLMTPQRARDRARLFQAWATRMEAEGDRAEAVRAERKAAWWVQYAIALEIIPRGEEGEG